ncbi:MAG TPA: sensor histidine kinase [Symbiobacteriaceae bacterium]|nr:sensor histidine kinase [Symbiobacteriaceae bacterium]
MADAGALALAVANAFAPAAQDKQVRFDQEIGPGLPTFNVDGDRIKQVLLNLLGNALRHTPPGRAIALRVHTEADHVTFVVADTGEGIAPDDLPHVFDRFYRGEKSRSRAGGGSGLGLAIARGIVEAHGGTISVESQLGEGSTFRFILPITGE